MNSNIVPLAKQASSHLIILQRFVVSINTLLCLRPNHPESHLKARTCSLHTAPSMLRIARLRLDFVSISALLYGQTRTCMCVTGHQEERLSPYLLINLFYFHKSHQRKTVFPLTSDGFQTSLVKPFIHGHENRSNSKIKHLF